MWMTEDGEPILTGELLFCYYTMKTGFFPEAPRDGDSGWADFHQVDGTREFLNGERVCSLRWARSMGWLKCWCGAEAEYISGATDASPEQPTCAAHVSEAGGYEGLDEYIAEQDRGERPIR